MKIWKISQKEYNRIKALNKNLFFNRRALKFKNKYYEHDPNASLTEIWRWQKQLRDAEAEKAKQTDLFNSR